MKSKLIKVLVFSLALILLFGAVSASAFTPYSTYTYSIEGKPLESPAAYNADKAVSSVDLKLNTEKWGNKPLGDSITDVFADYEGNVYVADEKNKRVVVANKTLDNTIAIIDSYVDEFGVHHTLNAPKGIYVVNPEKSVIDSEDFIYICDINDAQQDGSDNKVVVFNSSYEYVRTIKCPTNATALLKPENFKPSAIAVDIYGRIFIISAGSYQGVVVLSHEGDFTGYIGAQKVSYNFFDEIWKNFQSEDQKASAIKNLSYAYNNITIDDDGFVYVTTDEIEPAKQLASIKTKAADYSPVKKLNSTGIQIMKRNGFFDPGGEVDVFAADEVSKITDVALGEEGAWTILDYSRSRFFTYDQNGNLLFAFGDKGTGSQSTLGNCTDICGITYQVVDGQYNLIAVDRTTNGISIVSYVPSDYYNVLMDALRNQNEHNYSAAISDWEEVLTMNSNLDLAYIGIGKALYSQGKYAEAYEMLQHAYETEYASKAFAEDRKGIINDWILLILVIVIALIIVIVKFMGYAKKKNKATALKVGKKTYWEELIYAFHLVFHPFDGFWDLKHEKRGSVRAATTILGLTLVAFAYQAVGQGYLYQPKDTNANILFPMILVILLVMLWTISNWCLTTLFDGEGSFKDIYIATCYSLAPLPLFIIVTTILTNMTTVSESSMVGMLSTIAFIWTGILLFFGTLVTHDYSINKNIITIFGTILAMVIIVFIALLFINMIVQMIAFVVSIFTEVINRV